MKNLLYSFFKLKSKGTDIKTELIAGATIFLTVIYIIPLNGIMMSKAGMPYEAVITATALITVIATVINGLWANTPIAMSVGLGLNSYFAFGLVIGENLHWKTALGVVFISGALFLFLTLTSVRRLIIEAISSEFKIAISAGIGLFIAFIGLKELGIIRSDPVTFVALGKFNEPLTLLGVFGIFITVALSAWKVKGAFIFAIIITAAVGYLSGISPAPESFFSKPASLGPLFFGLDVHSALRLSLAPAVITFMLTDLFDSLGTLSGVGHRAGLFKDRGAEPVQRTLEADALATVVGSLLGVSTTTSFIESAAGVEEGGRSGLTAVAAGLLFVIPLFMLPLFAAIPSAAVYPVLVFVGFFMFSEMKNIDFSNIESGLPAFFIIILMPLAFSITAGLSAGFIVFSLIKIIKGRIRDISPILWLLTGVSVLNFLIR